MTPVVIDASAGAEIVLDSARGRALARLLPQDAVGWVPEHFYAEVLGVVRRRFHLPGRRSGPTANPGQLTRRGETAAEGARPRRAGLERAG